jgi:hypothetical protein
MRGLSVHSAGGEGGSPTEPDMMVLDRRLTPSSGHLGAEGVVAAGRAADSRPEME